MTFYLSDRQKMKMSYRSYCWQKCGEKMCLVTQSRPTLWDPMDFSLPGFSVHGIFQGRILQWVAIPSSRGNFPTQGLNLGLLYCRQSPVLQADSLLTELQGKLHSLYTTELFVCPSNQYILILE